MGTRPLVKATDTLLIKLRPGAALGVAEGRTDLEPLHPAPLRTAAEEGRSFRAEEAPRWFMARLDGAATPWDAAHQRVADQLGVEGSDVLFAEPDLIHQVFPTHGEGDDEATAEGAFGAVGENCDQQAKEQDGSRRKAARPGEFAWHLGDDFSQLASARADVDFEEPRTKIAHLDTGYFADHETVPEHVQHDLEWNFVGRDRNPSSATDPDNWLPILDNSGHGTGTLSILAGGKVSHHNDQVLGGAPDAAVVPIRVADSVVLLRTSALARALRWAADLGCEVATLSMGGVPTRAWGEAVDHAYLTGLCLCAAAGNRVGILPPKKLVYPARYQRVIAVCGVMANGKPYKDLAGKALEGSFGPKSAMKAAMAAYTPNIPWALFGCRDRVRLNGEGTSSATPQVAAAAALWIEKHKHVLPKSWKRVEAVRHALFQSAKGSDEKHFGAGVLQAQRALAVAPDLSRPMARQADSSFGFLRVLTGIGLDGRSPREEMYNTELAQLWLMSDELQEIVPDPEVTTELADKQQRRFLEAVIEDDAASLALRRHLADRYPVATGGGGAPPRPPALTSELPPVAAEDPQVPDPPYRRLRVYALDPSLAARLDTGEVQEVVLKVRWEHVTKGPVGEYLEVVDKGPRTYDGVVLNDKRLLAQDGWAPSEGNPEFHQQMVYAVAMKTIEHFETALGRPVLWRALADPKENNPYDDSIFVPRLEVRPHAMEKANAFYSPRDIALRFGYYRAPDGSPHHLPGAPIYTCLSHDVIAHETTHAVLDGMHRRFSEPTNPDVLAFHEGFADIVSLLQHFTIPELLKHAIYSTRGDLEAESLLGKLAVQFGQTATGRGALRSAIGRVEDGVWMRNRPDPSALERQTAPHARGAILVAAVFDGLLAIYKRRVADLLRIATGGTGVLPAGAIHPDLADRLAREAAKAARHVLHMCIRALDFLPPVDTTFFDYLRAMITADFEMVRDDRYDYRTAMAEAFGRRGVAPGDFDEGLEGGVGVLSAGPLRWPSLEITDIDRDVRGGVVAHYQAMGTVLREFAGECLYLNDRKTLFESSRARRGQLQRKVQKALAEVPGLALELGLETDGVEVHALRRAMRMNPAGRAVPQVIVGLTSARTVDADPETGTPKHQIRGGSTLVLDLTHTSGDTAKLDRKKKDVEPKSPDLPKYRITKSIHDPRRQAAAAAHARWVARDPLRRAYLGPDPSEPFAMLHDLADGEH